MKFVLVHGVADRAASWDEEAAALRGRGHQVVAVDLPCEDEAAGLERYADTVVDAVGPGSDDLIVVGHSLGGYTATLAAWPDIPTRYVACTLDNFNPIDWTRQMVRDRLGIEVDEIDAGHCPYITRPDQLARILDSIPSSRGPVPGR